MLRRLTVALTAAAATAATVVPAQAVSYTINTNCGPNAAITTARYDDRGSSFYFDYLRISPLAHGNMQVAVYLDSVNGREFSQVYNMGGSQTFGPIEPHDYVGTFAGAVLRVRIYNSPGGSYYGGCDIPIPNR